MGFQGQFLSLTGGGIIVKILDRDDIYNDCKCNTSFNAFKNIYAGFTNGIALLCKNFDAV